MKKLLGLFATLILVCGCSTVGKIVTDNYYREDGSLERKTVAKEFDTKFMKTDAKEGFGTSDNDTTGGFSAKFAEPLPFSIDAGFFKKSTNHSPVLSPTVEEFYDENGKIVRIVRCDKRLGKVVSHTNFSPVRGISVIDDFAGTGPDLDKLYGDDTGKTILDVIPTLADTQLAINIKEGEVTETQAEKFSEILKEVLSKASEILTKEGE